VGGGGTMFRSRKSRANILGLVEALHTHQKHKQGKKKKKTDQYRVSVSPRDEGYITGNEKNYELLEHIEDDYENWEVDSDHDQDEKGYDDASTNTEKPHDRAPVRNQTASQVNLMGMHKPLPCPRAWVRSSPADDYMWSLAGVQSLLQQQHYILSQYRDHLTSSQENSERRQEIDSLRSFKMMMDKRLSKRNILYNICDL